MTIPLKTIAIADDDPSIQNLLKMVLSDLGYVCVGIAHNGEEAIELARLKKPQVMIMDVHMPVLDGLQATAQISALGTTAVVMVSADQNQEIVLKAMDLGACGYLQKPFDRYQVSAMLESAWHRFQIVSTLQSQTRELTEALETRKLIEKAKGILMEQQGFSEEEAHKCLQKMSQDQGLAIKEVCRSVIQVRMVLGKMKQPSRNPNRAA